MSSDTFNYNYFHLITPLAVVVISFCVVYCTRYRRRQRQGAESRCIFSRTCSRMSRLGRRDNVQEFYQVNSSAQREGAEGDARFNLEYQHFPSNTGLLHTQDDPETGDNLLTKPADAPPSYIMAVQSQAYTPRTPSPLTFNVSATPAGEGNPNNLPPPYRESVKQDEDNTVG